MDQLGNLGANFQYIPLLIIACWGLLDTDVDIGLAMSLSWLGVVAGEDVSLWVVFSVVEVLADFLQLSFNVVLEFLVIQGLTLAYSDFLEGIEDGLGMASFNDFLDSLASNCSIN